MDYRKLNAAARKDHFPLPFIDQMVEHLAGHDMSLWDICLPSHAFWAVQCTCYCTAVHDQHIFRHGRAIYRDFHG
jgi:hypothetical protein